MSKSTVLLHITNTVKTIVRTPLWITLVATEGLLALTATALTVLNSNTTVEGLDAGRMALSFDTFLVLAFGLFTIPAIVDRMRNTAGLTGFVDSFVMAFFVGWSLIFAATPAFLWAMFSTGVSPAVWIPALGTLKLEVLLVDAIVALAFSTIAKPSVATAVSYGAIASLVAGPLLALGAVSVLPGVKQTTEYWSMEWKDEKSLDPVTGYPIDPKCPSPTIQTQVVPRFDLVWAAAPIIPFALVSESVTPEIATFHNLDVYGTPKSEAPIDLFSTISISIRSLQIPTDTKIVINECTLLAETGQPYVQYPYPRSSPEVLTSTQSGFTYGLVGQGAIVAAWVAGLLVIPRFRRKK